MWDMIGRLKYIYYRVGYLYIDILLKDGKLYCLL